MAHTSGEVHSRIGSKWWQTNYNKNWCSSPWICYGSQTRRWFEIGWFHGRLGSNKTLTSMSQHNGLLLGWTYETNIHTCIITATSNCPFTPRRTIPFFRQLVMAWRYGIIILNLQRKGPVRRRRGVPGHGGNHFFGWRRRTRKNPTIFYVP